MGQFYIRTYFLTECIFSDSSSSADSSCCDSKHLVPTTVENKTEASQNGNGDKPVITKPRRAGDKISEQTGQLFPSKFTEQRYLGSREGVLKARLLGEDDYLGSDISDTDGDHRRDDPHQIFSPDQIFSRLLRAEEETSANYATNEALITDIEASTLEFESLAEYQQNDGGVSDDNDGQGELVCTLLVPEIVPQDNVSVCSVLTPDSDRDSGCFSEEQGVKNPGEEQALSEPRLRDQVDTNLTENRDVCKLKRGKSVQQQVNFPRPSYRPAHNYTGGPRPFQRKIWKRRNGWFRVRYPPSGGQAQAQSVRSQLCETAAATEQAWVDILPFAHGEF